MILLFMLQIQHYCFMGKSIYSVLVDPGFKVPSHPSKASRETATALIAYCGNPQSPPEMFSAFAKKLTSSLSCCFVSKQTIKAMWGHYHTLRSSDSVRSDWIKFVQESVCRTPSHSPFQWCMLTASTDDDNAAVLLHRIIELYVTTRVFICKLMLYKKSSKRALQKGKGIHKELFTSKIYNTMS